MIYTQGARASRWYAMQHIVVHIIINNHNSFKLIHATRHEHIEQDDVQRGEMKNTGDNNLLVGYHSLPNTIVMQGSYKLN